MTLGELARAVGNALRGIAVGMALTATLAACTATVRTQYVTPPVELMRNCNEPKLDVVTNEDLTLLYLDTRGVLRECNADKRALREWAEGITAENPK